MAGRPPNPFSLRTQHADHLREVVRSRHIEPQATARARILLARAEGTPVDEIARLMRQHRSTVWLICKRYEARGLDALYDAARPGRPRGSTTRARAAKGGATRTAGKAQAAQSSSARSSSKRGSGESDAKAKARR